MALCVMLKKQLIFWSVYYKYNLAAQNYLRSLLQRKSQCLINNFFLFAGAEKSPHIACYDFAFLIDHYCF